MEGAATPAGGGGPEPPPGPRPVPLRARYAMAAAGFHRTIMAGDVVRAPQGPGRPTAVAYDAPYPEGRNRAPLEPASYIGPIVDVFYTDLGTGKGGACVETVVPALPGRTWFVNVRSGRHKFVEQLPRAFDGEVSCDVVGNNAIQLGLVRK